MLVYKYEEQLVVVVSRNSPKGKTLKYQSFVDRKVHKGPMGSLVVIVKGAVGELFVQKAACTVLG